MTNRSEDILQAIEQVAQKKHVISQKALDAKKALDEGVLLDHQADSDDEDGGLVEDVKTFPIADFNRGLHLVRHIIRDTRFDDFSALLKYPGKLMVIHFFLGLFRGLGFALGLAIVGFLAFYVAVQVFPVINQYLFSVLLS